MALEQVAFKTSSNSYLQTANTAGEDLAKFLINGVDQVVKYEARQKALTEEEDKQAGEYERNARNATLIFQNDRLKEAMRNGASDAELADLYEESQKELTSFADNTSSKWAKANEADMKTFYTEKIITHRTNQYKAERADWLNETSKGLAVKGIKSIEDVNQIIIDGKMPYLKDLSKEQVIANVSSYVIQEINETPIADLASIKQKYSAYFDTSNTAIFDPDSRNKVTSAFEGKQADYAKEIYNDVLKMTEGSSINARALKNKKAEVLNDDLIPASSKNTILEKINSALGSGGKGYEKAQKLEMKHNIEIGKKSLGNGDYEKILAGRAIDSTQKYDLMKVATTKNRLSFLIKANNYQEINKILAQNATFEMDNGSGKKVIVPYDKSLIENYMQLHMSTVANALMNNDLTDEQINANTKVLVDMKNEIPSLKTTFETNVTDFVTREGLKFKDLKDVERHIKIGKVLLNDSMLKNGAVYRKANAVLANQYAKLKEEYSDKDGNLSKENQIKILSILNGTKTAVVREHNVSTKLDKKEIEILTHDKLGSTDERKDSVEGAVSYVYDLLKDDPMNGLTLAQIKNMTANEIEDLLNEHTEKYQQGGLYGMYASVVGTVWSDDKDAVRIPRSKTIRASLDKIIGNKFTLDGKSYDIPNLEDTKIKIISAEHIQILDKSNALILDLSPKLSADISSSNFKID